MDIRQLQKDVYCQAVEKGLYNAPTTPKKLFWHIRSEAQEVTNAFCKYGDIKTHYECDARKFERCTVSDFDCSDCKHRRNEGVEQELADVIIMTLSACEHLGIDAEAAIASKMKYNAIRER